MAEQITTSVFNICGHLVTFSNRAEGAGLFLLKCGEAMKKPSESFICGIIRKIRRKAFRDLMRYAVNHGFPVCVDNRPIQTEADIEAVLGTE